ncbi:MAG TPA: GlsB/YeaQ/YmgE family stress response membrane protein [Candidatus Dormibacteraeota bacterium]
MGLVGGTFTVGGLLAAFVGAVILLVIVRALTGRGMIHR